MISSTPVAYWHLHPDEPPCIGYYLVQIGYAPAISNFQFGDVTIAFWREGWELTQLVMPDRTFVSAKWVYEVQRWADVGLWTGPPWEPPK